MRENRGESRFSRYEEDEEARGFTFKYENLFGETV
jgi:hypothetical protein